VFSIRIRRIVVSTVNSAGVATPATPAVTVLVPSVAPGVKVTEASPWASVVVLASERVPPPEVTLQSTVAPETGSASASVTRTTNGTPSSSRVLPLWPSPETTATAVGSAPPPPPLPPSVAVIVAPTMIAGCTSHR
jgi:hypothetical protein